MLEEINKLRQGLRQMAAENGPAAFHDATVLAVDSDEYTCDIELDGLPVFEVRLRAVVSNNQSIDVLPVKGSAVIVGKLSDDDFIVLACDEIASWRVTTASTVVAVDADGVQISKGAETLREILTDLITVVLGIGAYKDAATLTQLLNRTNNLLK